MDQASEETATRRISVEQPHLLLVEGSSDQGFWRSLLRGRQRFDIQVEKTDGKDNLRLILPNLVRQRGFGDLVRWIGIMQDADDDPSAAFDRVCGALSLAALPVPARPWEAAGSDPPVVVFVLPDGVNRGDFESLLQQDLATQPAAACVDGYLHCLGQTNLLPRQRSKAWIHSYLASLARPDLQLSIAILAGQVGGPGLDRLFGLFPPP